MNLTCTKENIVRGLVAVSSLAGKTHHLPILTNVLIRASEHGVELITTNLEMVLKTSVRAKVEEAGSFTAPAKMLLDFLGLLPEEQVQLSVVNGELQISSLQTETKIKGLPADEFPVMPEIDKSHAYVVDANMLRLGLSDVIIAAAKTEIRPELSGICTHFFHERFSGILFAATDSYRLAEKKVPVLGGEGERSCIIPARAAYEMIRLLATIKDSGDEKKVTLYVTDQHVALSAGGTEFTSRLIDARYPDYTQIIPTTFKTNVKVSLEQLENKIKAASLFSTAGVNSILFEVQTPTQNISITSTSAQAGEHHANIDVAAEGEDSAILLNHRYVLDGLQHLDEEVLFSLNGGDAPCMLRSVKNDSYLYIVMPIRR